jgi:hypothetical protein
MTEAEEAAEDARIEALVGKIRDLVGREAASTEEATAVLGLAYASWMTSKGVDPAAAAVIVERAMRSIYADLAADGLAVPKPVEH